MTDELSGPEVTAELEDLRARLAEAEEVLRAIRNGEVDALVVTGERGEQVYTLTEQKLHEQIVTAERQARLILEQVAEAVVVCDEQCRVIRISQAALRFCDGSPLLRPFAEAFPMRTDAFAPFHIAPVFQGQALRNVDVVLDRHGHKLNLLVNAGPLLGGLEILGCVVTLTDITKHKRAEEQIQLLSRFPSENPNPVLRVSAQGVLRYANAASDILLPAIGAEVGGVVNAEWQAHIDEAIAKAHPVNIDVQVGDRTFGVTLVSVEDLGYVNLYTRDITERKRMEDVLRENEERYRALIGTAIEGFWVTDREGQLLEVNDAYCAMSGCTKDALLSMNIKDLESQEAAADVQTHIQKIVANGSDRFETKHRHADGTVFDVEASVVFLGARGELLCFFGDITKRKRTANRLAKINACLLDLGPDFDANVAQLTTLCGELLGATCALYNRLEGAMLCSIGHWHTPPGYALQDKPEGHICYDVIRQEGDEALVVINLPQTPYAATDPNVAKYGLKTYFGHVVRCAGEPVGSLCAVFQKDVEPTDDDKHILGIVALALGSEEERKHLEAQFRQAQKMEAVGRLAGGVAHDFNNMLQVILMNSDMALRELAPKSPLHESMLEIHKAGKRSADLTRQLLAFARKQTIAPIVLNLNEIVASMLKMLGRLIGEDIDLSWKPANNLGQVKMDPAQIDQILANLVVNARDAIAGVGKVTIETANAEFDDAYCEAHIGSVSGMYAMLAVSDDGCGMDKKTQANIFEPFFTTKEMGKGTGLGLATVYGVVKQNNGFINVYSEPGQGTTFKIYLPRYAAEAPTAVARRERAALPRGTETVLLVEDEEAVLRLGKRLLEHLGYTVLAAGSPSKAVQLAQEHAGDLHLVLTDVVMPEMSGRDLWQRLSPARPGLKCLFMSGYTANVIAHEGVLDEGVHFLEKPFSVEALAAKVRETLDA